MKPNALSWAALLGLLSAGAACSPVDSASRPDYPPGHPCQGKGNCQMFIQEDDGGAADLPDGGVPPSGRVDGGRIQMCGACNG
jgi:hypothetical protein